MAERRFAPMTVDVLLDEHERITSEVPCLRCGYNQRGLTLTDSCPECGADTWQSARGNHLHRADPQWVATLARGINLVVLAIVAFVLITPAIYLNFAVIFLLTAVQLLSVLGYAWLLTPDPMPHGRERIISARRIARILHTVSLILWLFVIVVARAENALGDFAQWATAACFIAALFASIVYLQQLARRLPDRGLETQFALARWAFALLLAGPLLFTLIAVTLNRLAGGADIEGLIESCGSSSLAVGSVLGLWYAMLLVGCRTQLSAAARQARRTRARERRHASPPAAKP